MMATRRKTKAASVAAPLNVGDIEPKTAVLREFIADFNAAGSLMRKLRRAIADSLDLTATEYAVMVGLWYCQRRGGETNVKDLADHLHVAAAHVTAELGKLLHRKLVSKAPSLVDKRALSVQLTERGHDLLNALAPRLGKVNQALFAGVSYGEMVVVHQFLRRIVEQAPDAIFQAGSSRRARNDDDA